MKDLLTPHQVACALGVSDASLKRWCDRGYLPVLRTAGGHRRLPIEGVLKFIRDGGRAIVRPEVLGLPAATGRSRRALGRVRELMQQAVRAGDEDQCRRLIFNLYISGHHAWEVCDQVIAPAFHQIGEGWKRGEIEVYQERRGCELCHRVLDQLRLALPAPSDSAPSAIGATPEADPYTFPTTMVEITLREAGWRAQSFGAGHPAGTLCAAIKEVRPRLFWLSVSSIACEPEFLAGYEAIYRVASDLGVAVVVGGRALTDRIRQQMQYAAYCDNLGHLVAFCRTVESSSGNGTTGRPQP